MNIIVCFRSSQKYKEPRNNATQNSSEQVDEFKCDNCHEIEFHFFCKKCMSDPYDHSGWPDFSAYDQRTGQPTWDLNENIYIMGANDLLAYLDYVANDGAPWSNRYNIERAVRTRLNSLMPFGWRTPEGRSYRPVQQQPLFQPAVQYHDLTGDTPILRLLGEVVD